MPRGRGTSLGRRTVPVLALSLVLLVVEAGAPAASGNAPRPASPWGGVARTSGTPKQTERPAGPATRPAASVRPQQAPGADPAEWALTFSDDFDDNGLNKTKWSSGFGWGNDTNSNYGFCDPAENVVSGGYLAQRIERRPNGGEPFSVGCINSKDKFAQQYGYWEARLRTARCSGSRSAFWGKPNDESWPPEIDVVEVNGDASKTAKFTVHWDDGGHRESQGNYTGPDFSDGFHTFGAQWTPGGVTWFVDGVERRRTPAGAGGLSAGGAFYTILNSQVIDPDSTCGLVPADSVEYVDYVRVWTPAPPPSSGARPGPGGNGPGPNCRLPVRVQSESPLPPGTGEASGAVASQRYPGLGWFIRDSGNPASLYAFRFDQDGRPRVREVPVTGGHNRDWEDLVYWMRPNGTARILIPESGQGGGDTSIYEVPEPAPDQKATAPAVRYRYRYPDGKFNTESAFMAGDHLVLVTKTTPGRIYRFDDLAADRVNVPLYMGPLAEADRVSVVRLSRDYRTLVAVTHERAYIYEGLSPVTPVRSVVGKKPSRITSVDIGDNVEAGDWFPADSCTLLLLAESRNSYQLRLTSR